MSQQHPVTATGFDLADAAGVTVHQVAGMTCAHCVHAVTAEVSAVPGVNRVDVDLAAGRVTVTSDRPVDRAAIAAAVDEAGYTLL